MIQTKKPDKISDMHDEQETGWTRIFKAAYNGDFDILLEELNKGISADISTNLISKNIPFFNKNKNKNEKANSNVLLPLEAQTQTQEKNKKEISFRQVSPLYLAAQRGNLKCVKLLMQRGASPRAKSINYTYKTTCTPLEIAILHNNFRSYFYMSKLTGSKSFLHNNHLNHINRLSPLILDQPIYEDNNLRSPLLG